MATYDVQTMCGDKQSPSWKGFITFNAKMKQSFTLKAKIVGLQVELTMKCGQVNELTADKVDDAKDHMKIYEIMDKCIQNFIKQCFVPCVAQLV